ncbi:hypothetical protein GCM10008955_14790 [Deinococcus malanensis]|uniref:Uncharacterized protein n=1 Tax=Deinococcus malanensis TaxID=1706855 RepID=A0ABQ2EUH0_9DEIO|nr:hypothetical protein [Deinococcus malanensis]GGK22320.1 hypothetical protein GCM10008955_14790 [Deinococcus malanensis]
MKRALLLAGVALLSAAALRPDQEWEGKGGAVIQNIPFIKEGLHNRLTQFGLARLIAPVAPAYALTQPELTSHTLWHVPYQMRVFNTTVGAGYAMSFGPQAGCPDQGAVRCNLGSLTVRVSDRALSRKAVQEVPLVGALTGHIDAAGMWWRLGKANYDLLLTNTTALQLVILTNAALTDEREAQAQPLKLTGTIGQAQILSMDLRRTDDEVWGSYLYQSAQSSKARLYLYGRVRNRVLTLNEYDLSSRRLKPITGTFRGMLTATGSFSGIWTSPIGKNINFKLAQQK